MLNQVELIGRIVKALEKRFGFTQINQRQFNAVIKAADLICEAMGQPHVAAAADMGLAAWLASDDTGLSSRYMAFTLAPAAGEHYRYAVPEMHYPRDPDDLGRCLRLLQAVPSLRPHLRIMAASSPEWAALVGAWDELEALYALEAPSGTSPKLYQRMKALLAACRNTGQGA